MNEVKLLGNLGRDVEVQKLNSGSTVARFFLATNARWTDQESGEQVERTDWHFCKVYGRVAEVLQQYTKKGAQVLVEGSLRTDKYVKDDTEQFSTYVQVRTVKLLGSPRKKAKAKQ